MSLIGCGWAALRYIIWRVSAMATGLCPAILPAMR